MRSAWPAVLRGLRIHAGAAAVLVAIVAVLALPPTPTWAHAVLVSADPPDGADLPDAPERVELTFDEPVELAGEGLRVYDADASRVDTGPQDDGDARTVAVDLRDGLPAGGYVITYRVISADGHPVGGVLTFTVGGADAVDDALVAELFGGAGASTTGVVGPVLRGLGYAAALLAAGAVAIAALVARREEHRSLARRVGVPAALVGAVLALLAVPVHGAAVAGVGVFEAATSAQALREALASGFGEATIARIAGLVALAALWRRPSPTLLAGIAAGVAVASYLRDGHQRTVDPAWIMIPGDALHLAAGAVWFAGLVLMAMLLRARAREGSALSAAQFVASFSSAALWSVALLAVSGLAMAWPLVGTFGALTSTSYGWTLLGKVAAVVAVVVVAIYNRQRLVPLVVRATTPSGGAEDRPNDLFPSPGTTEPSQVDAGSTEVADADPLPGQAAAWQVLTTTVRFEAVVLVGVLLITGFLVSQRPAAEDAGLLGLYETTAVLGDGLEVDVVVDPNRVGRNAIHLYVVDATGRPADTVDDVTLELTYLDEGIGPIVIDPMFAGPGHWTAVVDDLRFAGDWELRVIAGVDRFTELTTEVTIPVAR